MVRPNQAVKECYYCESGRKRLRTFSHGIERKRIWLCRDCAEMRGYFGDLVYGERR